MKSTHLEDVHSADLTQMYFCLFWLKIQIYVINATFFPGQVEDEIMKSFDVDEKQH